MFRVPRNDHFNPCLLHKSNLPFSFYLTKLRLKKIIDWDVKNRTKQANQTVQRLLHLVYTTCHWVNCSNTSLCSGSLGMITLTLALCSSNKIFHSAFILPNCATEKLLTGLEVKNWTNQTNKPNCAETAAFCLHYLPLYQRKWVANWVAKGQFQKWAIWWDNLLLWTPLNIWLVLLLYVPSQQLWSLRDGQFT